MQLRKSGDINGRPSVFVVPATMPIAMEVVPSVAERATTWGQVAYAMAADVACIEMQPVESDKPEEGVVSNRATFENPYAYADKDFGWQQGRS